MTKFVALLRAINIGGTGRHARHPSLCRKLACARSSREEVRLGLHHDELERVATYGVVTARYRELVTPKDMKVLPGMHSRRGGRPEGHGRECK